MEVKKVGFYRAMPVRGTASTDGKQHNAAQHDDKFFHNSPLFGCIFFNLPIYGNPT